MVRAVKFLVLGALLAASACGVAAGEVDAPEGGQRCERSGVSYDCGAEARAVLSRLVEDREVRCEARYQDRYSRTVARCFASGADLGGVMVREGWALDYERYSKGHYAKDQTEAKAEGWGLWSGTFVPPWKWRHRSKP